MNNIPVAACLLGAWAWGAALLLGLAPASHAARLTDLYTVEIPVSDQSESARRQVASEGLAVVLVRISGNNRVLSDESISQALDNGQSLLGQFSYVQGRRSGEPFMVSGFPDTYAKRRTGVLLRMRFQEQPLIDLLRNSGQLLWPDKRPAVLVCLVVADEDGWDFASSDNASALLRAMEENMQRRGMPLLFAEPGGEQPRLESVLARDQIALQEAAVERQADAVLIGQLYQTDGQNWNGSWDLLFLGRSQELPPSSDGDFQRVTAAAVDATAARLADYYAVRFLQEPTKVLLRTSGVRDFGVYAQAMSYLNGLLPVHKVDLVEADEDVALFELSLHTEMDSLSKILALDRRLKSLGGQRTDRGFALSYEWQD